MFSPGPPKVGDPRTAFAAITIPMFYWTGTKDDGPPGLSKIKANQRRVPFDMTGANDAYLVVITGGDHMIFNGRLREQPILHPNDARVAEGDRAWDDGVPG